MDPAIPADAQQIVGEYLTVLEGHAEAQTYPVSAGTLPFSKDAIKTAIRTSVASLIASNQLTSDMREYLELAYVSLADYVDAEVAALITQYNQAAGDLASDSRLPRERIHGRNWEILSQSGRLAGQIARAIADETESLRGEFRAFSGRPSSAGGSTP